MPTMTAERFKIGQQVTPNPEAFPAHIGKVFQITKVPVGPGRRDPDRGPVTTATMTGRSGTILADGSQTVYIWQGHIITAANCREATDGPTYAEQHCGHEDYER